MVERSRCQTYGFFLYKNLGIGGKTSKPVGCCCLIPCSARWQYLDAFIDFQLRLLYLPLRPSASAKDFWIGCVLLCFFFFFLLSHKQCWGRIESFCTPLQISTIGVAIDPAVCVPIEGTSNDAISCGRKWVAFLHHGSRWSHNECQAVLQVSGSHEGSQSD